MSSKHKPSTPRNTTLDTRTRQDQIKHHLIDYILRNKLSPGNQLPSEAEMAKKFGVSRNTLREAYISLAAEGVLNRRHGIGTFVTRIPVVEDSLSRGFSSFPNRIRAAGFTPHFHLVSKAKAKAPSQVCELFATPPSTKLLRLERTILADEIPTIYLVEYFSPAYSADQLDWEQFTGDMIDFVASIPDINLSHLHVKYQAVAADSQVAAHLKLPKGIPIVTSRAILYTFDNHPIVYSFCYLNPNIFQLDAVHVINPRRLSS